MKSPQNLMKTSSGRQRCHAKSKRTGLQCKSPVVPGWNVCRMHGAGGGHKAGPTHPRWKDGRRSQAAALAQAEMKQLLNAIEQLGGTEL